MIDSDWDPARVFFEKHKARADLSEAQDWNGWSQELDGVIRTLILFDACLSCRVYSP